MTFFWFLFAFSFYLFAAAFLYSSRPVLKNDTPHNFHHYNIPDFYHALFFINVFATSLILKFNNLR